MTTTAVKSAVRTSRGNAESEPFMLRRRIGSTMFIVNVRFSNASTETLEDKLLRLIEREVDKSA